MNFIKSIFSDVDGSGSSKRLITFVILLLIVVIAIGVTFFNAKFNDSIWSDLIYTLLAGFGFITAEKFTKRGIRNEITTTKEEDKTNAGITIK